MTEIIGPFSFSCKNHGDVFSARGKFLCNKRRFDTQTKSNGESKHQSDPTTNIPSPGNFLNFIVANERTSRGCAWTDEKINGERWYSLLIGLSIGSGNLQMMGLKQREMQDDKDS
ncbi:uncharacterized protein LOC143147910 [Ptiloglossa arizonensis]|uniref:uncharacterized protein LOC143147910 n=1 Tax=Ptiloglossa arizonensis TaxID=3350558 RepID=UPI003FA0B3A4